MKKKILVPTDLTSTADKAIFQALAMAKKMEADVELISVVSDDTLPAELVEMDLNTEIIRLRKKTGITCERKVLKGSLMSVIEKFPYTENHPLMVIGTHGIHGLKQRLMGSSILKLVSKSSIPVLVVQEKYPLVKNFNRIVLPVASHTSFYKAVHAVTCMAELYQSEICLYSIQKNGFEWPDQLVKNIDLAISTFEEHHLKVTRVREGQNVYSQGYAKQTLNYAHSVNADAICIMSIPSKEYYYFAQADKEHTLLNDHHIPVLCAGGGFEEI